jgi:hypothetical protein
MVDQPDSDFETAATVFWKLRCREGFKGPAEIAKLRAALTDMAVEA